MDAPLKRFLDSSILSRVLRIRKLMNRKKVPTETTPNESGSGDLSVFGDFERAKTLSENEWIDLLLDGSLEKQTTGDVKPWERQEPFKDFPDEISGGTNL